MFDRLQNKWKVNGLQLVLILCTFAIGGSLTGYLGKIIMNCLNIEYRAVWIVVYIIVATLIWPMAVLLISIPFGQYRFFTGYLKKMGRRMGLGRQHPPSGPRHPVRVAIFASGAGSNAQKIIDHFKGSRTVQVALVVCNNPKAGVLNIAAKESIPAVIIDKNTFLQGDAYLPTLHQYNIGFIVLAGFLWKIPDPIIQAYPNRIVNIHPALLPGYGGKGMYGHHVHEAVITAGEKESGITIHYVDGHYDNGNIIFQARCAVMPGDTAATLAQRVHQLEHAHYPRIIEEVVEKQIDNPRP